MNSKTKALLAFIAVFIIAFASGYLLGHRTSPDRQWRGADRVGQRGPADSEEVQRRSERMHSRARDRMADFLDLTEDQRDPFFGAMESYMSDLRRNMSELRAEEQEMIRDYYQSFREEVTSVLDTLQVQRLDSRLHPDSVRQNRMRNDDRYRKP